MRNVGSSRLLLAWIQVRDSLWFLPGLAALGGGVLAMTLVQMPTPDPGNRFVSVWLFSGGAEGARGVLSAIAGSLITVTGTVFSVTIVALQLASSQFTPRVLGSFVADRVNQVVLAIFIGTFTYTLLVLRTIRSEADDRVGFVPHLAVSVSLVLLLVSVGALIVFINHAARSMQVAVVLARETQKTLARVAALFPEGAGAPGRDAAGEDAPTDECPLTPPAQVAAQRSGYVQSIHSDALLALSGDGDTEARSLVVRMEVPVGGFVIPGMPLASIWPPDAATDGLQHAVRDAVVLGESRTPEQDVEFGLVELSDIAVRALSPGVNDPTTAMHGIDRLTEVVAALVTKPQPSAARVNTAGTVRLVVPTTTYARAIGIAFDQVRFYGARNPGIAKKLLDAFATLAQVGPRSMYPALIAQTEAVRRQASQDQDPQDAAAIEALAAEIMELLRKSAAHAG